MYKCEFNQLEEVDMGWNEIYANGEQLNKWPWTDLVSAVKRHCGDIEGWEVLELGCGPSAPNMRFFLEEKCHYTGLDFVTHGETYESAVSLLYRMVHGNFTKELPEGPFDIICDRAAVTHNTTEDIKNTLRMAYEALKPGGYYIGIDWFSELHPDKEGEGQFKDCGTVTFSNGLQMKDYFSAFELVDLKHKLQNSEKGDITLASFDIVCRKQE